MDRFSRLIGDRRPIEAIRTGFLLPAAVIAAAVVFSLAGCGKAPGSGHAPASPALVGAWRSSIRFESGPFSSVGDLEFMLVFNQGGTMTESSNYDAAPPVPPAYGIWRQVKANEFEARYEFYVTGAPADSAGASWTGGWIPAGRGVLTESIALSPDGTSYTSTIDYRALDAAGQPTGEKATATGRGTKLRF
jgi:hypothetical protein